MIDPAGPTVMDHAPGDGDEWNRTGVLIHNSYGARSGEEVEFDAISEALEASGLRVRVIRAESALLRERIGGRLMAGVAGVWNPFAARRVKRVLEKDKPGFVLLQNLYPVFSPSILRPVFDNSRASVMRVPNYRLICPNGLLLSKGEICERCVPGREYWCVARNCERDLSKSAAYAIRAWIGRTTGVFHKYIDVFMVASQFLRTKLIAGGFEADAICVVPNVVASPKSEVTVAPGSDRYVAYVGRLSEEKGVRVLREVATACPDIPFVVAGRSSKRGDDPFEGLGNVRVRGFVEGEALEDVFRGAAFLISPSQCHETFGMSIAEAALRSRATVATRVGAFAEYIREGATGVLTNLGNAEEMVREVRKLWASPEACRRMGSEARRIASAEYSGESFGRRFRVVLEHARARRLRGMRRGRV